MIEQQTKNQNNGIFWCAGLFLKKKCPEHLQFSQTETMAYNDCRAKVEFVATVLIDTFIWEQAGFIAEKIINIYFIVKTMQR